MKMNKVLMVLMTVVMVLVSAFVAVADDCQDCCGSDPCYGDDNNSPRLDVVDCTVQINDRIVKNDVTVLKAFDRGEDLQVEIEFVSLQDAEDVQVMAFLTGYHRGHNFVNEVFDMTSTFDVDANVSYKKTLQLKLPDDFEYDTGDELKIRVQISDKFSAGYMREYNLKVEPQRDNVIIQDIILDPSTSVQSGRGLFASVRVKNMGMKTEESIRIEVLMPALGLKATEYIDELEEDEATTSEDLFLRIPSCVEAGSYVVRATVTYADGDEYVSEETSITVTEDEACGLVNPGNEGSSDKTVVTVPGRQDVIKGTTGTVYPVILQNNGATDRAYELSVSGVDSWATYRFDPGAFVLIKSGETKTVYLYVTPSEDAPVGEKVFMVSVETSNDQKQIALTANVIEGEKTQSTLGDMDLTKALEIGVIVLIVLLIVLGLIVGFNKLKGNDNEPEEVSGQTYY